MTSIVAIIWLLTQYFRRMGSNQLTEIPEEFALGSNMTVMYVRLFFQSLGPPPLFLNTPRAHSDFAYNQITRVARGVFREQLFFDERSSPLCVGSSLSFTFRSSLCCVET